MCWGESPGEYRAGGVQEREEEKAESGRENTLLVTKGVSKSTFKHKNLKFSSFNLHLACS